MSLNFFKKIAILGGFVLTPALMQAQTDPLPPAPPAPSVQAPCVEAANTWCTLPAAPAAIGTMLLLTDGRVIAQENNIGGGCGSVWAILTPALNGDYAAGTWTTTAAMSTPRLYFGSTVLQNGKVWVLGGEYSGAGCGETDTNTGEVYDPVANTWTAITNYPNANFGDDPSELLPNGRIIAGDLFTNTPQIWTPTAVTTTPGTWAAAASKVYNDRSDEEGWAKITNGNIVNYDLFASIAASCTTACFAEQYTPNAGAGAWSSITPGVNGTTGTLQLLSSVALGYELGPAVRLQDGRILVIGANQLNALYNPTTNSWAAGPPTIGPATGNCPSNCAYGADDAPLAELPSGHVLYLADAGPTNGLFDPPTYLFDFNPATNTTSLFALQPPPLTLNNSLSGYYQRLLMLPTGQMLYNDSSSQPYIYTPTSTLAAPPYRPVVQNITGSAPTFTLTGLQLNGPSAGAYYGDDVVTDENYPIVRIVNTATGNVYYCKSTNWSSVSVGNTGPETVTFTVPGSAPAGNYSLIVSGAGVQGVPVAFTYSGLGSVSAGTGQ